MDITELLAFSHKQGASDMHLSSGLPPMIRVDGDIRRINGGSPEDKCMSDAPCLWLNAKSSVISIRGPCDQYEAFFDDLAMKPMRRLVPAS